MKIKIHCILSRICGKWPSPTRQKPLCVRLDHSTYDWMKSIISRYITAPLCIYTYALAKMCLQLPTVLILISKYFSHILHEKNAEYMQQLSSSNSDEPERIFCKKALLTFKAYIRVWRHWFEIIINSQRFSHSAKEKIVTILSCM